MFGPVIDSEDVFSRWIGNIVHSSASIGSDQVQSIRLKLFCTYD